MAGFQSPLANFLAKQNPLFAEDDDVDAVTQFGQQVAITQRKAGQAEVNKEKKEKKKKHPFPKQSFGWII